MKNFGVRIYVQMRRSRPLAMLHAFDEPVMEVNCDRRQSSTVATQSLMLMNSQFMLDQAARFAKRVRKEVDGDVSRQVARAWQLAFNRSPTEGELADAVNFLGSQTDYLKNLKENEDQKPKKDEKAKAAAKPAPEFQALTDLCQALLSANEFLYVD